MARALGRAGSVLMLCGLLFAAPAAANHVQCGDVITKDTTLDSDLTCSGDGPTLEGDVTLDLARHVIHGSDTGNGLSSLTRGRVVVRGGRITGFGVAIYVDGPDALLVQDVQIDLNAIGVNCQFTEACDVLGSRLLRNSAVALSMHAPDFGVTGVIHGNHIQGNGRGLDTGQFTGPVTENRIERNKGAGVTIDYDSHVELSRNVVTGNGGDGAIVSFLSSATLSRNQIEGNGGSGIHVIGDFFFESTSAVVADNRINRNSGDACWSSRPRERRGR